MLIILIALIVSFYIARRVHVKVSKSRKPAGRRHSTPLISRPNPTKSLARSPGRSRKTHGITFHITWK